ncbi:MAG: hypothetical protein VW235_06900, partial [Rhodospirillaceae bacterium]
RANIRVNNLSFDRLDRPEHEKMHNRAGSKLPLTYEDGRRYPDQSSARRRTDPRLANFLIGQSNREKLF